MNRTYWSPLTAKLLQILSGFFFLVTSSLEMGFNWLNQRCCFKLSLENRKNAWNGDSVLASWFSSHQFVPPEVEGWPGNGHIFGPSFMTDGYLSTKRKERCSGSYRQAVGFLVIKDDSISERFLWSSLKRVPTNALESGTTINRGKENSLSHGLFHFSFTPVFICQTHWRLVPRVLVITFPPLGF